ncbi:membrane protein [Flavobacterium sp. 316]|uniref:Outer membrane protein beta-barrel domain-containing protein n=1 Tax=Flavobacterium sediminilitoris TaxID=2024526 RepID=A0ABY4HSS0_9FLAO|nr:MULTISPECIES: DUF6646 family protein [Flavobacterium]KIX20598.1 membrane protein [Flavobacterium sp. 316]UOX34819.1 hypothetical protein LXD69_04745 [Flavobacterium sediminilitoris]
MKKILFLTILFSSIVNAQVFTGKGDQKFQVGANFQNKGTGIIATFDKGIGKNMSFGFTSSYLLGIEEVLGEKPNFDDRFDIRARFSANIADIFNIEEKLDFYPGLNIGIKNFGAHLGARYFFSEGFGIYSEIQFPIAQYDNDPVGFEKYNNQFNFSIGASFNL